MNSNSANNNDYAVVDFLSFQSGRCSSCNPKAGGFIVKELAIIDGNSKAIASFFFQPPLRARAK